jgi:hypothetical protein
MLDFLPQLLRTVFHPSVKSLRPPRKLFETFFHPFFVLM